MTQTMVRLIVQSPPALKPWRCPSCGGMLARMHLTPGSVVEIKCHRCNALVTKEAA